MNKFAQQYEIRLALYKDIENIMDFIHKYWKKDHILMKDRRLFEYEFLEGKQVNIIIAINRKTCSIEGLFGFLPCSHTSDIEKYDVWRSLWKVNDTQDNMPLLGIELAKRVYALTGCRMHIGNGANPKTTIPLRKIFFHDKTGKMKQYYCLNPSVNAYQICRVLNPRRSRYKVAEYLEGVLEIPTMEKFNEVFDAGSFDVYPYKDNWYVGKRFYSHPYYLYKVFGLKERQEVVAVVICREIEVKGVKILRIVDYIGNHAAFAETGQFWRQQMEEKGYEYIDFYEFGMDDKVLEDAGFVYRSDKDKNVIPNYFEPFLQENIDIWVHYKYVGTTFFKADCDQDRPNIVRK